MKLFKTFIGALLAGFSIGLGGVAFLSIGDRVVGAAVFTVGLFTVCTFGLNLFTGKVCYVFRNDRQYALALPVIWLGNLAGTGLTAACMALTRSAPALSEKAMALCQTKLEDGFGSLFFLGILCNVFIYIAVEGFLNNPHELGKYLSLVFGVMGFILCGTEHCVADMFYFWMAGAWSLRAAECVLIITLGNCVGGVLFPVLRDLQNKEFSAIKLSTRTVTALGLLLAIEIVLSRFLSISAWNIKIGFSFVPIVLAAVLYGPIPAALVAALGDFLGALLFPIGPYFPGFTLTAFLTGLTFGLFLYRRSDLLRAVCAVLIAQPGLSLLLNSLWISVLYGSPYAPLLVTRLPQTAILSAAELVVILAILHRGKLISALKER